MRYASVCSGIEAPSVAWHPMGWAPQFFSEIEAFPCAVLAHHYPDVPNLGDMTRFKEWPDAAVDVLIGGTPCQSFSLAGLRKGLADPRGNLALTFLAIVDRYRPRWVVWENVPGVLSSSGGRDFGAFLGGLGQLGYGWAYRVLDAQYFGVAQRRRRVFVVGCLGDWRGAAAVLFERSSLSGHPAPRREVGERIAATLTRGADRTLTRGADSSGKGGYAGRRQEDDSNIIARCITRGEGTRQDYETTPLVAHSLRADGFDASEDGTGRGTPLVPVQPYTLAVRGRGDSHELEYRQDGTANALLTPNGGRAGIGVGAVAFDARQSDVIQYGDKSGPLDTDGHTVAVAFHENQRAEFTLNETAGALKVGGGKPGQGYPSVMAGMQVRRLTPTECERLQGFSDGYTAITYRGKPAADGSRYKALGNSMAVPVIRWIGRRIEMVEGVSAQEAA